MNRRVSISVVIPALNEERFIGRCLASLAASTYSGAWEAIVVDNGSRDRTVDIARGFAAAMDLTVVERPHLSVAGLRNSGAGIAKGERLIFLDADCVVSADWLEKSAECADGAGALLLGAPFRLPPTQSWVARVWWEYEQRSHAAAVSYLTSHNLHIRRADFVALGGFDERLDTNEDYEFSQRARAAGVELAERPEIAVMHLGNPETLGRFFRRERWHGRDVVRVFLRDVRKRHNLRAVAFAVYTLACVLAALAGVVCGLAWNGWAILGVALAALVAAPVALGIRAAAALGKMRLAPALAALFLVYGLARAAALADFGRRTRQTAVKAAVS